MLSCRQRETLPQGLPMKLSLLSSLPVIVLAAGCAASPAESEDVAASDESELTSDGNRSVYTATSGTKTCFNMITDGDVAPISESW